MNTHNFSEYAIQAINAFRQDEIAEIAGNLTTPQLTAINTIGKLTIDSPAHPYNLYGKNALPELKIVVLDHLSTMGLCNPNYGTYAQLTFQGWAVYSYLRGYFPLLNNEDSPVAENTTDEDSTIVKDEKTMTTIGHEAQTDSAEIPKMKITEFPIFSVLHENLLPAIQGLYKVLARKPMNPAHAMIVFRAEGSRLYLYATDGETVQSAMCGAKVDKPGQCLLPGKTLYDLLPLLSPERIDFSPTTYESVKYNGRNSVSETTLPAMHIRVGAVNCRLVSDIDIAEFPPLPDAESGQFLGEIPFKPLKELTILLEHFSEKNASRTLCQNTDITIESGKLTLLTTDTYAIAQTTIELWDTQQHEPIHITVNSLQLRETIKALASDKPDFVSMVWMPGEDENKPTLRLSTYNRDMLVSGDISTFALPELETVFETTLHNPATVTNFLKSRKRNESKALFHANNIGLTNYEYGLTHRQKLTVNTDNPFPQFMVIGRTNISRLYYTLQHLAKVQKSNGSDTTLSIVQFNEGCDTLSLAAEAQYYTFNAIFVPEVGDKLPDWMQPQSQDSSNEAQNSEPESPVQSKKYGAEYEIEIHNADNEDMILIALELADHDISGDNRDEIDCYLRHNRPNSIFVEPIEVSRTVEIINGLGFQTDEDSHEPDPDNDESPNNGDSPIETENTTPIAIGDSVMLTERVTERLTLQPGIIGTVTRINTYNDGFTEYGVYFNLESVDWDWIKQDECVITTPPTPAETKIITPDPDFFQQTPEVNNTKSLQDAFKSIGFDPSYIYGIFEYVDIADAFIEKTIRQHPDRAPEIWDTFKLMQPSSKMMKMHHKLYDAHIAELMQRVLNGDDLKPATRAEILVEMSEVASVIPIHNCGAYLFSRLFRQIFGEKHKVVQSIDAISLNEPYKGAADEMESELRHKLRNEDRPKPDVNRWYESVSDEKKAAILGENWRKYA